MSAQKLAALSKQSAIFLVFGHSAALLLRYGLAAAARHALTTSLVLIVAFYLAAAAAGSDASTLCFYLVTVPVRQPLMWNEFDFVMSRAISSLVPCAAFLAALWACWSRPNEPSRRFLAAVPCDGLMLAGASIALMPISFVATVKVGGYLNNLHAHYYLLLACGLALIERLGRTANLAGASRALTAAAMLSLLLLRNDLSDRTAEIRRLLGHVEDNPHALAYRYLQNHDDAYFPWHTLAVVESDDRS